MAMVKLGAGITEINGKVGGDVWRTDQCGQHIQSIGRNVGNEPTLVQKKRRRAWRTCMNYIPAHATYLFVALWQQYANQHPRTNKKGETYTLTWWQQFIAINVIRVFNDLPILQYPPND